MINITNDDIGMWTNMEDEILMVAVMKFGENQWPRISNLLSSNFFRKSTLQCKARWFEWLQPRIKKTEWTRQEDEMLVHAVKVNPGQWRTLAGGVVGRTASECIERYQRLLDAASGVDDDVQKLCRREGDGDRELRRARSDRVDMEANEAQMISEARARLSNAMGNKGIRKVMEKQLEESRNQLLDLIENTRIRNQCSVM
ncbi:cell division cycle 5-like protein [Apium graveolens]|uniref:cell division cycle 5-like protein n=1 Tax=Apium graveolens TaxID=4045 RepID=UPI003D7B2DAB